MRLQKPLIGLESMADCWQVAEGSQKARSADLEAFAFARRGDSLSGAYVSTLGLPRGFGSIYKGQDFRCCIVAIHTGGGAGAPALANVEISAELQIGAADGSPKQALPDVRRPDGRSISASVPAGGSTDLMVCGRVSMATMCALRVAVKWTGGDVGGRPDLYRKFYRFPVLEPLEVVPVLSHPVIPQIAASILLRCIPDSAEAEAQSAALQDACSRRGCGAALLRLTLRNKTSGTVTVAAANSGFVAEREDDDSIVFSAAPGVSGAASVLETRGRVSLEAGEELGIPVVVWGAAAASSLAAGQLRLLWRSSGGEVAVWESPKVLMPSRHLVAPPRLTAAPAVATTPGATAAAATAEMVAVSTVSANVSLVLAGEGSVPAVGHTVTVVVAVSGRAGAPGAAVRIAPGRGLLGHGGLELAGEDAGAESVTECVADGASGEFEAELRLPAVFREGGRLQLSGKEAVQVWIAGVPVTAVAAGFFGIDTLVLG